MPEGRHSGRGKPQRSVSEEEETQTGDLDTYAVIPPNGGWGWVVVACAFYCNVVVDGIQLTFGVFLGKISTGFQAEVAQVALAGSLMFGTHLLVGPVCAGLSKVFGLRPVAISGSMICCIGIGLSYFATGYWFLYISYGFVGGMGLGMIYMSSLVITSVYFTTLLPLALALVVCGTGVGTMVFAGTGHLLLERTAWRTLFLMQAALAGSMVLAAATFKPLKQIKVELTGSPPPAKGSENASEHGEPSARRKTVFVRTNTSNPAIVSSPAHSIATYQSLIWNFVEESVVSKKTKTSSGCLRCKRKKRRPTAEENVVVLSEVKSDPLSHRRSTYLERSSRPGSADDSDHPEDGHRHGKLFTKLYFEEKTNKRMSVMKTTLKAMLDCHLMASLPFVLFTMSGALQMASFLIVLLYEKERCLSMGYTEDMSVIFIIFLGGANVFWRLFLGGLASLPKANHWAMAITTAIVGGVATMCSGFSSSIYYKFGYCFLFGLGVGGFAIFRIVLLIDLVGKEKVENATGINLLFMGLACIASPPFFGFLMKVTNSYDLIFIITGILSIFSGIMLIGLNKTKV